jgi:hypothetical protein
LEEDITELEGINNVHTFTIKSIEEAFATVKEGFSRIASPKLSNFKQDVLIYMNESLNQLSPFI